MENKGCHLEAHILGALPLDRPTKIFDSHHINATPVLKPGCCNRILLYPGSFNPPHVGHFNLLKHAYHNSDTGLNVIAAIVLPHDDQVISNKVKRLGDELVLTKSERAQLWTGGVPCRWFWVYDRSEAEWGYFQNRLTESITREGYQVSFVLLCGPECFGFNGEPPFRSRGCRDVIVSDISHPASFATGPGGHLNQLLGCTPWMSVASSLESLRKRSLEAVTYLHWAINEIRPTSTLEPQESKRLSDELFHALVEQELTMRICYSTRFRGYTVRYIPRPLQTSNGLPNTRSAEIHSTEIRRIMKQEIGLDIFEKVKGLVLSPELFISMLYKRGELGTRSAR